MLRTLKPPPKIKAQSEHSFNDDVKLEMYRLKKSMENYPEVVEKRLTRNTSTRTFASEEEDTRHHIAINDYRSGGNEHANDSRLPLIGGSQNLNNTTPAGLHNVMNREDFIYSGSPGQNVSPGRRIGAGLRDIMGTGENGDRTNKRAAEQAAYAAALQEQISDKKRNPGGNKLRKNMQNQIA